MPSRSSSPPVSPILTVDQICRRIRRLQACIHELQGFNPQLVQKRHNITEVITLQASIKDALATAFGPGTPQFNFYQDAAKLDQGPHFARVLGRSREMDLDAEDAQKARTYLTEGKERSIQLLERAVKTLEDGILDHAEAPAESLPTAPQLSMNKVFLVHGRDNDAKNEVARFLSKIGLEEIILHERPNNGRHLLTKFQEESEGASFAVVLMTPDDEAGLPGAPPRKRARQNVVFELGFFIGKLGNSRVAALFKGDVEKPSDFDGVGYIPLDAAGAWKSLLARELQAAKVPFNAEKVFEA